MRGEERRGEERRGGKRRGEETVQKRDKKLEFGNAMRAGRAPAPEIVKRLTKMTT